MMIIKVCGMSNPENIEIVEKTGIDWMGFIFYPPSKRFYAHPLPIPDTPQVERVGVFVNESVKNLLLLCKKHTLTIVQLHGNESPEYCKEVRKNGLQVVKAFGIDDSEPFPSERITQYEGCADYFLFDTKTAGYGGSGRQFNWEIIAGYEGSTPFFLSGGISPEDASGILSFRHPMFWGIDLNSKFESKLAVKDVEKIKLFIQKIRK